MKFNGIVTDTKLDEETNKVVIVVEIQDDNENRCIHLGECIITQEAFVENNKLRFNEV